jgi:hypothetical protein
MLKTNRIKIEIMERTITVYHKGAIAYYNVFKSAHSNFKARLLTYLGSKQDTPPQHLKLHKDGNQWVHEDNIDRELADELGFVIEMQRSAFEPVRYNTTNHPSE